MSPVAGTTRYLCPLECGWHHDVPPPSVDRAIELGAMADPAARDFQEAVGSVVRSTSFAERAMDRRSPKPVSASTAIGRSPGSLVKSVGRSALVGNPDELRRLSSRSRTLSTVVCM